MKECPCLCMCDCGHDVKTQIILYPQQTNRSNSRKRKLSTKRLKINNSIETITRISSEPSTQVESKKVKYKGFENLAPISEDSDKENSDLNILTSKRNAVNGLVSYTSNRSIKTLKNGLQKSERVDKDITVVLLSRENVHLRDELDKLKREEADLLRKQRNIKQRNNREISHLTNVSDDLRRKSLQRKKEMDELQQLLKWRKSYSKVYNIPKGKKEKNKQKLNTSTRPTICGTLSTTQKQV